MTDKSRKPMPEDPKELARAMFRDADRKLAEAKALKDKEETTGCNQHDPAQLR